MQTMLLAKRSQGSKFIAISLLPFWPKISSYIQYMSPIWNHIFRREDNSIVYFVRPFSQRPCESQLLKSMNKTFYFFIGGAY